MLRTTPDYVPDDDEPVGTILVGSAMKRAYLYVCQSEERMQVEHQNAADYGVQDLRDFVFILDGVKVELTYLELKERLLTEMGTEWKLHN